MPSATDFIDDNLSAESFLDTTETAESFLSEDASSPSLRPSHPMRETMPEGSSPALSLADISRQRFAESDTQRTELARQREAGMLTPEQTRRLDEGSIAENLMTAPPGVEWTPPTASEIQERFPTMSEGNVQILAGLAQTGAGAWNFTASPIGAGAMAVAPFAAVGGAAGAAGKAALATFAIDAVRHTPQAVVDFESAVRSGDLEAISRTGSQLLLNTAVAAGAGRGVRESVIGIPKQEAGAVVSKARAVGLEESAKALDQLARQVEKGFMDVVDPLVRATSEARPSGELLATPEALRRTQELQVVERTAAERPAEMVGPEVLTPISEGKYRTEIVIQATEAVERIMLARQRKAQLESGKLERSGQEFSGQEATPGFATTAEQRVTRRPSPQEPDVIRDPVITESTPLKDVEQLVRENLEKRDMVAAASILGQLKSDVSRTMVDKLLHTKDKSVPLSAGERTIFNQIWDSTLEKMGAPQAITTRSAEIIQRLESLKTPLEPGVGANPFPQIARAVWNTSLDIAIAAVKAGAKIGDAINSAIAHLKKNAQGFDEADVRSHIEKIVKAEAQLSAGSKAAEKVSDKPMIQTPESAKVMESPTSVPGPRPLGDIYSEPLVSKLGRIGGPVAKTVTQENLGIVNRAKRLYGEIEATILDTAKRAAGKAYRGGTTWIQGLREITPNAAVSRFHDAIETRARTGNWDHVPEFARPLGSLLYDANLAVGRLAELANPQFKAGGRLQRILSEYGYDIVRRGKGRAWEAWKDGLAKANNKTPESVEAFLHRWKSELDKPGADATHLDRIAQDFVRQFPNVVTHVRPLKGAGWHEIVRSSPFQYLEASAQRTAHAVAFREIYPLIEHEGKMVTSGKLEATRKAVQKELNTADHPHDFDNLMKALQGHPLDTFSKTWNAPDTPIGMAAAAANVTLIPQRALMLSASSVVNVGETLSGGAHIFLGYGRAFHAMTQWRLYSQAKRSGQLNAALRDFSFDPSKPARSVSRQTANVISRTFFTDLMNELQEFTGAAAARIVANELRAGTLPKGDVADVINTMRAMDIPKERAKAAVEGRDPQAVEIFETKAAEFFSAGNQAMAEKSRLGASRPFNNLFWFHSYPMSKMRQFRSIMNNLIEDVSTRDTKMAIHNANLMGKFLGGTVLAGAITNGVLTLLNENLFGLDIRTYEATDDPAGFIFDSFLTGMGGPLVIASKIFEGMSMENLIKSTIAPVGIAKDMYDAAAGQGRFEGTDTFERIGLYLRSRTPISRAIKQGMAVTGLSEDNVNLDTAIKHFYQWRRGKFGHVERKSFLEDEEDRKAFRSKMRKAVESLKDMNISDFDDHINSAFEDPEVTMNKVKSSLRGRTILKTPDGREFTDDEMDALRSRIGNDAVEMLLDFDSMLKNAFRSPQIRM